MADSGFEPPGVAFVKHSVPASTEYIIHNTTLARQCVPQRPAPVNAVSSHVYPISENAHRFA